MRANKKGNYLKDSKKLAGMSYNYLFTKASSAVVSNYSEYI